MTYEKTTAVLQNEYKNLFTQAESYGLVSDLDKDYLEECLTDLSDLLITAQEKKTPIEKLVGKDMEAFCRSYFSEFTLKDRAANICKTIFRDFWFVLIINILLIVGADGESVFTVRTNGYSGWFFVFNFLYIILYNVIFSTVMRRIYFRIRHAEMIQTVVTVSLVILSIFIGNYFKDRFRMIPAFVMILISGGYILCYLLVSLTARYRRTGHFFDPVAGERRTQKREQNQIRREKEFVSMMAQIYVRQNEIRRAKGKPEISRASYMEKFQRENRRKQIYMLFLILAELFLFAVQYLTRNWWMTVFAGFTFVIDAFAILFIWYMFFSPYVYRMRQNVEDKCKQSRLDILAYAQWLESEVE